MVIFFTGAKRRLEKRKGGPKEMVSDERDAKEVKTNEGRMSRQDNAMKIDSWDQNARLHNCIATRAENVTVACRVYARTHTPGQGTDKFRPDVMW
jgi:hypothetical protein